MFTQQFDQWLKNSKEYTTPLSGWNKVASDLCQKATQQQLELMAANISLLTNQLRRLTNIKRPDELLHYQTTCLQENTQAAMKYLETLLKASTTNVTKADKATVRKKSTVTKKHKKKKRR